ncbi:unnamed protein product, partial [Amoebophrya sp. A120]|eukprot:GSA120T00003278001.1
MLTSTAGRAMQHVVRMLLVPAPGSLVLQSFLPRLSLGYTFRTGLKRSSRHVKTLPVTTKKASARPILPRRERTRRQQKKTKEEYSTHENFLQASSSIKQQRRLQYEERKIRTKHGIVERNQDGSSGITSNPKSDSTEKYSGQSYSTGKDLVPPLAPTASLLQMSFKKDQDQEQLQYAAQDYLDRTEENVLALRNEILDIATTCAGNPQYYAPQEEAYASLGVCDAHATDGGCFEFKNRVVVNYNKVGIRDNAECLQRGIARLFLDEAHKDSSDALLRQPITQDTKDLASSDLGFATVVLEPSSGTTPASSRDTSVAVVRWPHSHSEEMKVNHAYTAPADAAHEVLQSRVEDGKEVKYLQNPLRNHDSRSINAPWYVRTRTGGVRKNVVLSLDVSKSMELSDSWPIALDAVKAVLDSLDIRDRFFVSTFEHTVQFSAFEFVHATPANVARVKQLLENKYPFGGINVRPDSEFAIGTSIVIGTLGVVPGAWRDKFRDSNDGADPPAVGLPPDGHLADRTCPSKSSTVCEQTVVLIMTDEDYSDQYARDGSGELLSHWDGLDHWDQHGTAITWHGYDTWIKDLLQSTARITGSQGQQGGASQEPAVYLDIYRFYREEEEPPIDLSQKVYTDITAQFGGEVRLAKHSDNELLQSMGTYWRRLRDAGASEESPSTSIIWSAHEDVEGYHLNACVAIDLRGTSDLQGVVCLDPRAALSLSMQQLRCLEGFDVAVTEMLARTDAGTCSINSQQAVREAYCENLEASLAGSGGYNVVVPYQLILGDNWSSWNELSAATEEDCAEPSACPDQKRVKFTSSWQRHRGQLLDAMSAGILTAGPANCATDTEGGGDGSCTAAARYIRNNLYPDPDLQESQSTGTIHYDELKQLPLPGGNQNICTETRTPPPPGDLDEGTSPVDGGSGSSPDGSVGAGSPGDPSGAG